VNELLSPSPRMTALLKRAGSYDYSTASVAQSELAKALTLPLRKGVLKGDIVSDIYKPVKMEPGQAPEFPLDLLAPGTESRHVAYTIPATGRIPERHVDGDYLMVATYDVGSSIDLALRYVEEARWDVVKRALQVLEGGFVRKMNTDGWRVLLAAGVGRNLLVYDDAATAGLFSKRLVAILKTYMRRNAGGNSSSVNRGRLTDLYMSPEGLEDIRSWTLTEVDDVTRREIFLSDEYGLSRIFGVTLHDLDELGINQEFQDYFTTTSWAAPSPAPRRSWWSAWTSSAAARTRSSCPCGARSRCSRTRRSTASAGPASTAGARWASACSTPAASCSGPTRPPLK
jgi:hypothetical protein